MQGPPDLNDSFEAPTFTPKNQKIDLANFMKKDEEQPQEEEDKVVKILVIFSLFKLISHKRLKHLR